MSPLKAFLSLVCLLLALPALAAADEDVPAPEPPKRLIVKFKGTLVQEIENTLPPSLELEEPALHVRPALFQKVAAAKLKPLYPSLVREKKQKGASDRQLADAVKRKFAARWQRGGARRAAPEVSGTYVVDLANASEAEIAAALAHFQADPDVEFAQREQLVQADFTPNDPYFATSGTWGQSYQDLYGLYRIQSATAWDITTGQGAIVAVVDTGIDSTHPDLTANLWTNTGEIPANGIDDDGNGYIDDASGWDFVGASYQNPAPDNNPSDPHGHGTHVAGTIAAPGNNGLGVVGLAWGARVMAVRGLDNAGTGTDAQLASAAIYAANNGADVINNSYGGKGFSQVLLDAMNYAHSLGVVVVASAGNDNARVEDYFPASYPNVITVSAYTAADGKAYFSNWGSKIDVAAPGDDILSLRAAGTSRGPVVGSIYVRLSGTSMAAPHVSGLAALILAQQPGLTAEQVRQVIRVSADDVHLPGVDKYSGSGRINATTAITIANPLESKIQWPIDGQAFGGPISFGGVAQGPDFASYILEYGSGETPTTWTTITQGTTPVNEGELGAFEPNLVDGRHSVRLRAYDTGGRLFADLMSINVRYASITSPMSPPSPGASQTFKPGVIVPISGTARGPSFVQYRVEWARGRNPSSGWTTAGIALVNAGLAPITNNVFATFDTASVTQADYYTIRLLVDNSGFTSEVRTMINLEPALFSGNWPRWLWSTPTPWAGLVPARDANGLQRLFMIRPAGGFSYLTGVSPDGSAVELVLQANASFQPAAANIDGNPGDEVIVGDGGSVRIVRPDLSSYTFTPAQSVSFQYSRTVIDDLNNDGSPEIVILGNSGPTAAYLYAFKTNGQLLTTNFPIQLANANLFQRESSPARFLTVDLNADGLKEILVAESTIWSNCIVRAFNWDGTPYPWPQLGLANHVAEMAAGDMDGDGGVDIVFAYLSNVAHESFLVVDAAGAIKPGWPLTTYPVLSGGSRLALADLDGDGGDELIASSIHKLFAWKANGSPLSAAWPVVCENTENISVADVDGDGYPEVLASRMQWMGSYDEYNVVAVRRDGVQIRSWRLTGQNGYQAWRGAALCPGDFNEDGVLDFGAWYAVDTYGSYGMTTAISANTPYNPATISWQVNFRDAQNTSVSAPARAGAPSIQITSPSAEATLVGTTTLAAIASDDAGVVGVQFQVDNLNVGAEVAVPPYSVEWDTRSLANANHTVKAIARDAEGHITAVAITIVLNNDMTPPTLAFTSPTNGAAVAGIVAVSADASDNVGVIGVQFKLDDADLGAEFTAPPYALTFDSRQVTNGTQTLSALARDAAGNVTASNIAITVNNDVTPPTVSFTSPSSGATVAGVVSISANASDDFGVIGVQFKLDGTNFGSEFSAPPYSLSWNTLLSGNGTHTLSATARDAAGHTTTTNITVTVNNDVISPTVSFTSPSSGATVAGVVSISANASDDFGVIGVQFKLDGTNFGSEFSAPPYSLTWNTLQSPNGTHTLSATARDAAGHVTTTNITVTVNNDLTPPTVAFTAPLPGATVAGVITVSANASDDIGVAGVQFKRDGVNLGAEFTAPPYSLAWDTRTVANGAHTLSVVARDAAGRITTSNINVTVNNDVTLPTVSITAPANNTRVAGAITISATASDNVGVVGVRFRVDGANIGAEDTTAPYSLSWNTTNVTIGPHSLTAVARDAAGNTRTSSVITIIVTNVVKVNFQPAAAPTYSGYFVDSGAVYGARGNGYSYGWDLNNSANAFDRNAGNSPDQRYDTLITTQVGGTFTWEIGVPNGRYRVRIVAGDPSFYNSVYRINAEGVLTVNATPSNGSRWKEGTSTVTVSDGRLTVSKGSGANNNKLCFIELMPVP